MKLLQTIVSRAGFRDPSMNDARTALLRRMLSDVRSEQVDLVILPGGYWSVRSEKAIDGIVTAASGIAEGFEVAIIAGADVWDGTMQKSGNGKSKSEPLPFWGFAAGNVAAESGQPALWKQSSSTSADAADVADEAVPGRDRVVRVKGCRVGTLICGELFSWRARESMASLGLDLAVDLGHVSMGTGVTRAMENISRNGRCAVAHTQHVAEWGDPSIHFVAAGGERNSMPVSSCSWVGDESFWIAWQVRHVQGNFDQAGGPSR